jgi:heme-degrading monooxygenase HmoA
MWRLDFIGETAQASGIALQGMPASCPLSSGFSIADFVRSPGGPPDIDGFRYDRALTTSQEIAMLAVIFEVWPAEGRAQDYFDLAAALRADLEKIDGFVSIERFQSLATPGKFVSISFWRDEAAIRAWRSLERHRSAQAQGRAGIFADYRLRVASVVRDYGMNDRTEAPRDSRDTHG